MKNLKLLAFFLLLSGVQLHAMQDEASSSQLPDEQAQDTLLNKGIPGFLKCLDDYIQQKGWQKPAAQLEPMTQEELIEFNNQLVSYLCRKWFSLEYQVLWEAVQSYRKQEEARNKSSAIEGDTPNPITAHDELPDILAGISPRNIPFNSLAIAAFMDDNYDEIDRLRGLLRIPIDNKGTLFLDKIISYLLSQQPEYAYHFVELFIEQIEDNQTLYKQFVRLLKQRANLKAHNHGVPPLTQAAIFGCVHLTKVFIEAGADVNHRGDHHFTPLHIAAFNGNFAFSQILLEAGADVNARNSDDGRTPLDEAKRKYNVRGGFRTEYDYEQIIELLEQAQHEHERKMRATVVLLSEAPVASTSLHNVPNTANSIFGKPFGSDHA